MNKTFYKNAISPIHMIISILLAVGVVIFGITYQGEQSQLKIAIFVIGFGVLIGWNVYSYNKSEIYKKVRLTEDYIQVVSTFKIGFKIEFKDVATVGKLGMAVTKTSYEKYFISTVPLSRGGEIDLNNTITFDITRSSKEAMEYLIDKYGWELVEI